MSDKKLSFLPTSRLAHLAAAALIWSASGAAMAFPCSLGYVDGSVSTPVNIPDNDTTDNYSCIDGALGDNNDEAADLTGFFGITDWLFLDKYDTPPGTGTGTNGIISISNPTLVSAGGSTALIAGNWSFLQDLWASYSDVVIVVKDGGYPAGVPTADKVFWTAYHVTSADMSGDFAMPTRNLSHISVYASVGGGYPPLPEPGTVSLLGLGLLGLAAFRRRKPGLTS